MGNRIRTIWALSLASAILLIGMQGYWLYNQYQYVVNAYAQDMSGKILEAGEKELRIRNSNKTLVPLFINNDFNLDSIYKGPSEKNIALHRISGLNDEVKTIYLFDSFASESKLEMKMSNITMKFVHPDSVDRVWNLIGDSLKSDKKNLSEIPEIYRRSIRMSEVEQDSSAYTEHSVRYFSVNPNISKEYISKGLDQAMINDRVPFCKETLDSILITDIPGIEYEITSMEIKDSIMTSTWYLSGSLFSPHIKVLYVYSILENKGVEIDAAIPSPTLFKSMAVQLLFSLSLILLLTGCLVLQIKTILKQKKINELREDFVHAMIHELKRPVQTLKTFISFLGNKDIRSDELMTEQVIQDSKFELDNLSAYLKKLKDMIHANEDTTSLKISRFNLQELIGKIIRLVNHPPEKDVKISTNYDMESVWVEADVVHVANVVNNLIENAIKYSDEHVDIDIKVALKGKELWITVSDNGIGIPYSEKDKVFAKFYRGSNIPDKNIPGIGLGLSYVKLITEAHKGKVSLLSDIGKGTSVTLCLPQSK